MRKNNFAMDVIAQSKAEAMAWKVICVVLILCIIGGACVFKRKRLVREVSLREIDSEQI